MLKVNYRKIFVLVLIALSFILATGAAVFQKRITSKELGGKDRYLVYASTDKPIYRCGESVYFRGVILNAADNTPLRNTTPYISIKVKDPKGAIVFQGSSRGQNSSAGIKWAIPQGKAGGVYKAVFKCDNLGTPETERTFEIRAYRPPRLKSQIEFVREGYGPGDKVRASLKVTRAEGGIPERAKVNVIARVDGKEIFNKANLKIDKYGHCSTEFSLPEKISVGDGTLAFVIEDGGVVETANKTIPILLQSMDISFFPEGGDLVADLPCRIYVQAKRPDGKPADISGKIVIMEDGKASTNAVAELKTFHEGRGIFSFTPGKGKKYTLLLNKPSGINKTFPLPSIKESGAVLRSMKAVYPYDGKISVNVSATLDSKAAKVTICKREVELDSQAVKGQDVSLQLDPKDSEGILIVTVWNDKDEPLAERLVYRKPKFAVNVSVKASGEPFIPGGQVSLDILTTDENGKPVEAVVGLTITDDSVLEMIKKREQAPRLPEMVYLENDVEELADAHVYLDGSNAKSPQALDLLLGTQGWRRFILVRYDAIKKDYLQAAMRALAERVTPRPIPAERIRVWKGRNIDAVFRNRVKKMNMIPASIPAPEIVEEAAPVKQEMRRKEFCLAESRLDKECAEEEFARKKIMFAPQIQVVIREYAHQVRPNRKANERSDFSETLYWNAGIRTGARDGKASVKFALSDSITTFRVMADAFGNNGALGKNDTLIKSVEPFYIEPKMPLEVTAGDIIELPVALVNSTDETFESANLLARCEGVDVTQAVPGKLEAKQRARRIIKISPQKPGTYKLVLTASAGSYTDTVNKTLVVKASGFPIAVSHGGLIDSANPFSVKVKIPKEVKSGSIKTSVKVYPTPLANMEEALNALLRQPCGCFEQTSSTNYPLVMAQQYFTSHQGIDPQKISKAKELLAQGYKKLIGFECKKEGYEWFGGDPGHEALTAYGLMEFADMGKIMPVNEKMVRRTREWLLGRRDGKGGFKRNKRALDSFGRAPQPTTNAYIVWALLESRQDPKSLEKEIAQVRKTALASKDSYVIALAANILYLSGDKQNANKLAQKLAKAVAKDGHVAGADTSITRSGGRGLEIETTSLAILAWLKDDSNWAAQVETSMKWLFEQCKSGRFGSTQSTILVLKAINAYDKARAKPKAPGSVQLIVDGKKFGRAVAFTKDTKGAIELPDFSSKLSSGSHEVGIVMEGGSKMPFSLEITYNTAVPASSDTCDLKLETRLSTQEVREGEPLEITAKITVGEKNAPTPIAILGIPAGLEPRYAQLKELVKAGRIDSYEVIGRELVLYWRALKAGEKRSIPISLTATVPGIYTGPASRTYLYYTDEDKYWTAGHTIKVLSR